MVGFFKTIYGAFWSVNTYKNALKWKYKAFGYFLLLVLLATFAESFTAYKKMSEFFDGQMMPAIKDFAEFKIENGAVKTPENKVYKYNFPDGGGFFFVSATPVIERENYLFSIEKDELVLGVKMPMAASRYPLKDLTMGKDVVVDKAKAFEIANSVKTSVRTFALPMLYVSNIFANASYLLILTVAVFFMGMNTPLKLNMRMAFNISALAITPTVVFQTASVFFTDYDYASGLYGLISLALVWYMLRKLTIAKIRGNI